MKLRDLKLKTKQKLAFGIVLVIMAGLNFYLIHTMSDLQTAVDEVSTNWLPRAVAISDINLNTSKLRINQLQHTLTFDEEEKRQLTEGSIALIDSINANLDIYQELREASEVRGLYSQEEDDLYTTFHDAWYEYQDLSFTFFQLLMAGDHQEAVGLLNGEAQTVFAELSADLIQLVAVNKRDSFQAAENAERTFKAVRGEATLLLIATIVLSMFIAEALIRLIAVPIRELERASEQVASGDLGTQLAVYSNDEIGGLAQSFNQMTVALKASREQTETQAEQLRSQNEDLQDTLRELKDTQQQLLMREKMASLGDLVAGVAHEINTPIGTATSAVDVTERCVARLEALLRDPSSLDQEDGRKDLAKTLGILRDSVDVGRLAGERIASIVDSLKNFARLDEAEYQEADLHEGLDSSLTLLNAELVGRITVNRRFGEIPRVVCYPGLLNQVFLSLLKNASEAIDSEGTIEIVTSAANGRVHIAIIDDGKGIPPEKLEHLFDFGFSATGQRVKMASGLSTAYNVVQQHRGDIRVDSEVGVGTTVSLVLPVK